eukprot:1157160-Pelagomonas_calceolata.AAC.1
MQLNKMLLEQTSLSVPPKSWLQLSYEGFSCSSSLLLLFVGLQSKKKMKNSANSRKYSLAFIDFTHTNASGSHARATLTWSVCSTCASCQQVTMVSFNEGKKMEARLDMSTWNNSKGDLLRPTIFFARSLHRAPPFDQPELGFLEKPTFL